MVIVTTHRVGLQVFFQNLMPFTTGANRFLPAKAARLAPKMKGDWWHRCPSFIGYNPRALTQSSALDL